jgi:hypothetical protein
MGMCCQTESKAAASRALQSISEFGLEISKS